jgi:hypothetical protein
VISISRHNLDITLQGVSKVNKNQYINGEDATTWPVCGQTEDPLLIYLGTPRNSELIYRVFIVSLKTKSSRYDGVWELRAPKAIDMR